METTSSCATLITFDVSWHRPPLLCCMNAQEQKQQQLPSNCIFKMGSVSPAKEISVRIQISKDKGGHLLLAEISSELLIYPQGVGLLEAKISLFRKKNRNVSKNVDNLEN